MAKCARPVGQVHTSSSLLLSVSQRKGSMQLQVPVTKVAILRVTIDRVRVPTLLNDVLLF